MAAAAATHGDNAKLEATLRLMVRDHLAACAACAERKNATKESDDDDRNAFDAIRYWSETHEHDDPEYLNRAYVYATRMPRLWYVLLFRSGEEICSYACEYCGRTGLKRTQISMYSQLIGDSSTPPASWILNNIGVDGCPIQAPYQVWGPSICFGACEAKAQQLLKNIVMDALTPVRVPVQVPVPVQPRQQKKKHAGRRGHFGCTATAYCPTQAVSLGYVRQKKNRWYRKKYVKY
jgi:hypothetical protein